MITRSSAGCLAETNERFRFANRAGHWACRAVDGLEVVATGLAFPTAMAFGPDGKLYVANHGFLYPPGAGDIVTVDVGTPAAANPARTLTIPCHPHHSKGATGACHGRLGHPIALIHTVPMIGSLGDTPGRAARRVTVLPANQRRAEVSQTTRPLTRGLREWPDRATDVARPVAALPIGASR
jgi:hypothetical protein